MIFVELGRKKGKRGKKGAGEEGGGDDNVDEDPGNVDIYLPGENGYVNMWRGETALSKDLGGGSKSEEETGKGT